PSSLEPLALEESGLVEALDEIADLLCRRALAVTGPNDLLDLGHRMIAVEERDEVEQRQGKDRDLLGESRRVTQGDHLLAVLLHRKGFEHSKPWPFVHRGSPRSARYRGLGFEVIESRCCVNPRRFDYC